MAAMSAVEAAVAARAFRGVFPPGIFSVSGDVVGGVGGVGGVN